MISYFEGRNPLLKKKNLFTKPDRTRRAMNLTAERAMNPQRTTNEQRRLFFSGVSFAQKRGYFLRKFRKGSENTSWWFSRSTSIRVLTSFVIKERFMLCSWLDLVPIPYLAIRKSLAAWSVFWNRWRSSWTSSSVHAEASATSRFLSSSKRSNEPTKEFILLVESAFLSISHISTIWSMMSSVVFPGIWSVSTRSITKPN